MSDIQFNCPACTKSLVIDVKGAGRMVKCTDCGASVQVPTVTENSAVPHSQKQTKQCPFCGEDINVVAIKCNHCDSILDGSGKAPSHPLPAGMPRAEGNRTPSPSSRYPWQETEDRRESLNTIRRCPVCTRIIADEADVCMHCGSDLRTGKLGRGRQSAPHALWNSGDNKTRKRTSTGWKKEEDHMECNGNGMANFAMLLLVATTALLGYNNYQAYSEQGELQRRQTELVNKFERIAGLLDRKETRPAFEYEIASPSDALIEGSLNLKGKEGWEIVSARRATSDYGSPKYEFIMKRQIK